MQAADSYARFGSLLALQPEDRHEGLCSLDVATLAEYSGWLRAIPHDAA